MAHFFQCRYGTDLEIWGSEFGGHNEYCVLGCATANLSQNYRRFGGTCIRIIGIRWILFIWTAGKCVPFYPALRYRALVIQSASLSDVCSEVIMAMTTVDAGFWCLTPCNLLDKYERFGLTYLFITQEGRFRHHVLPKSPCLSALLRVVTFQNKSLLTATELLSTWFV